MMQGIRHRNPIHHIDKTALLIDYPSNKVEILSIIVRLLTQ